MMPEVGLVFISIITTIIKLEKDIAALLVTVCNFDLEQFQSLHAIKYMQLS